MGRGGKEAGRLEQEPSTAWRSVPLTEWLLSLGPIWIESAVIGGIKPSAPRVQHLDRRRCADLFKDTKFGAGSLDEGIELCCEPGPT